MGGVWIFVFRKVQILIKIAIMGILVGSIVSAYIMNKIDTKVVDYLMKNGDGLNRII